MKGTLHHAGTRHTLRFERRLAHSPEKVWRALTEASELAHWFPAEIHGPREQGAALRFVFPSDPSKEAESGAAPAMDGTMIVFDPLRTLEYSWNGEILRFELEPRDGHTLLVFTHTFEDVSKAARDASGWDVCLDALERRLDGREPEPFMPERFDALFGDYARQFGPTASSRRAPATEH
jgi:uncharacterized protein YndB with AHSA1/START domain